MPKLSFIGAGRMGGAIVRGLIRSGACAPSDIKIVGGANRSAKDLAAETGVVLATSAEDLFAGADAVILACKPQQFPLLKGRQTLDAARRKRLQRQCKSRCRRPWAQDLRS